MFTSVVKPNPFDVYSTVNEHFKSIKNLNAFVNYTVIAPADLITISNITFECVDKLGDLSAFYIKKINDSSISVSTADKLQRMYDVHNELLAYIYKFNLISANISDRFSEILTNNLNQDAVNFIYYDIINRHKLLIHQIFDSIKKLNIYVGIVKDKLN
jgi:hypothetical protein